MGALETQLSHLALALLARVDIHDEPIEVGDPPVGTVSGHGVERYPNRRPVFAFEQALVTLERSLPRNPLDAAGPVLRERPDLAADIRNGPEKVPRGIVTQYLRQSGIGKEHFPLQRDSINALDGSFEDVPIAGFALPETVGQLPGQKRIAGDLVGHRRDDAAVKNAVYQRQGSDLPDDQNRMR